MSRGDPQFKAQIEVVRRHRAGGERCLPVFFKQSREGHALAQGPFRAARIPRVGEKERGDTLEIPQVSGGDLETEQDQGLHVSLVSGLARLPDSRLALRARMETLHLETSGHKIGSNSLCYAGRRHTQ